MSDGTPIRKPKFRSNHSSTSSNCSLISPISSEYKSKASSLVKSSEASSGYGSLSKSKRGLSKSIPRFYNSQRRRLSIENDLQNLHDCSIAQSPNFDFSKTDAFLPSQIQNHCLNVVEIFDFYKSMVQKEYLYKKNPNLFLRQSYVTPDMRIILIDWMREVCDVYNLTHETFFLSLDYLDRYLCSVSNVPVHSLQCIGVTCLFIASKFQEITPPNLDSFANVTDGACNSSDILVYEAHILLKINWHLQPITPIDWMRYFLLIHRRLLSFNNSNLNVYKGPLTRTRYLRVFQSLLDTKKNIMDDIKDDKNHINIFHRCLRDISSHRFSYGLIAASLLNVTMDADVLNITRYGSDEISVCSKWLKQFLPHPEFPLVQNNNILTERTNTEINRNIEKHNITYFEVDLEKENICPLS